MYVVLVLLVLLMSIPLYIAFKWLFDDKFQPKSLLAIGQGFKRLIKRYKLSISGAAVFRHRLLAMDRKVNKLVLIVYKNGITWEKCVDLREIISCQIEKQFNKVSGRIQKVNLELIYPNDGIINFSFFDEEMDDSRDVTSRIKKGQYWRRKIQNQISTVQLANANQTVM